MKKFLHAINNNKIIFRKLVGVKRDDIKLPCLLFILCKISHTLVAMMIEALCNFFKEK